MKGSCSVKKEEHKKVWSTLNLSRLVELIAFTAKQSGYDSDVTKLPHHLRQQVAKGYWFGYVNSHQYVGKVPKSIAAVRQMINWLVNHRKYEDCTPHFPNQRSVANTMIWAQKELESNYGVKVVKRDK